MGQIGFVGLGSMGFPMAHNLLKADFSVRGYDIRLESVARFEQLGGLPACSPDEAATGADILVVVVVDADQAESVLFGEHGAAASLSSGALVMVCSTISPASSVQINDRLAAEGIHYIDTPMSGGVAGAENGTLTFMVGGPVVLYERALPVLSAMGEYLHHMGTDIGAGNAMKVVNQLLCGVHLAAMGEALALGAKAGIDPNRICDVISNSAAMSWMFVDRTPHVLSDDFTTRSAIDIWPKDLGQVLEMAESLKMPVMLASTAFQLFQMASGAGYGSMDDAAIVKIYEDMLDFHVLDTADS